jgi:LysR family glycine cleavage system transcriptional activator
MGVALGKLSLEVLMRLPPLNAMKAFESAARLRSFTKAAEELNVSAGVVSRHVKLLEEYFGVQLFERLAQGVRVTDAGLKLLPKTTAARMGNSAVSNFAPTVGTVRFDSPFWANQSYQSYGQLAI